uniref:SFRICE_034743 n=1 Tax=Spodoptera frugiperda TaxID=7108 RepID=A0A2H1X2R4_SPOFR
MLEVSSTKGPVKMGNWFYLMLFAICFVASCGLSTASAIEEMESAAYLQPPVRVVRETKLPKVPDLPKIPDLPNAPLLTTVLT